VIKPIQKVSSKSERRGPGDELGPFYLPLTRLPASYRKTRAAPSKINARAPHAGNRLTSRSTNRTANQAAFRAGCRAISVRRRGTYQHEMFSCHFSAPSARDCACEAGS
jgi:hypothetical protein